MRFWPPVTDDLPAPRDDEPSSLRQDIADELADHLNCAFTRELHLTRDEEKAKEKTLDRFGDPRRIARKLWLDAMQEKLMSQRMTFVALVVVLLASLGSTGLTWFLVDQARQVNQTMLDQSREANAALLAQSQDSNRALVEQSQKANESLIAKLTQFSPAGGVSAEPAKSLEWNPVKLKLITDETPPRPAIGYEVSLSGHILDTAKDVTITRKSNDQGIVDMGLIRPGEHRLDVSTPWAEHRNDKTMTVLPGTATTQEIVCPRAAPENTNIDFELVWPDDLRNRGFWGVCHFVQRPLRFADGVEWELRSGNEEHVVLIAPDGTVVPFEMKDHPRTRFQFGLSWPFYLQSRQMGLIGLGISEDENQGTVNKELNFIYRDLPANRVVNWPARSYRIQNMLVTGAPRQLSSADRHSSQRHVQANPPLGDPSDDLRKLVVTGGLIMDSVTLGRVKSPSQPADGPLACLHGWISYSHTMNVATYNSNAREAQPVLVADPNATINHWRIPIPERLAELVRNNLKSVRDGENPNPASEPATKYGP